MVYDQDDENKLKFLKNDFSFLEIDGMGRRVWKDALITRHLRNPFLTGSWGNFQTNYYKNFLNHILFIILNRSSFVKRLDKNINRCHLKNIFFISFNNMVHTSYDFSCFFLFFLKKIIFIFIFGGQSGNCRGLVYLIWNKY